MRNRGGDVGKHEALTHRSLKMILGHCWAVHALDPVDGLGGRQEEHRDQAEGDGERRDTPGLEPANISGAASDILK